MRLARGEADVAQEVPALHGSGMFLQPQAALGAAPLAPSRQGETESEWGAELGLWAALWQLLPCTQL